jgi:vacuolar iron transporter family protein
MVAAGPDSRQPGAGPSVAALAIMGLASVADSVDSLTRAGYVDDFRAESGRLRAIRAGRRYRPEELQVEHELRIEQDSDAEDSVLVLAIRAPDGVLGTYLVPFGDATATDDADVLPRLGRAEERAAARHHHERVDPHHRGRWLSKIVLGGQDGLVNTLAVILGVAAATADKRLVLVAGLAAALAESVSMAAVAYTSTQADAKLYDAERAREYRHIEAVPTLEREEVREIYARKGFRDPLLTRIVDTITRDKDVWVAVMMAEEHAMSRGDVGLALRSAMVVGLASLAGALLPLIPFLLLTPHQGVPIALALSATALFLFGAHAARTTVGKPLKSGLELAAIGTLTALLGYAIGALFRV